MLARLVTLSGDNLADSLFVYLEVGAYVHPSLLSNFLQIARSIPPDDSISIYTARTVTVSSLNKKAPFLGVTPDQIRKAEHQMDLLIFRADFLRILQEHLPEGIIAAKLHDIILNVAFTQHVRVIDLTPAGNLLFEREICSLCGEEEARSLAAGKAAFSDQYADYEGKGVAVLFDERCGIGGFAAGFDEARARGRRERRGLGGELENSGVFGAVDAAVLFCFVCCMTKSSELRVFRREGLRPVLVLPLLRYACLCIAENVQVRMHGWNQG